VRFRLDNCDSGVDLALLFFTTGRPGPDRGPLERREHHEHLPAVHARGRLDGADVLELLGQGLALLGADVAMGELATAEADGELHLVAVFQAGERGTGL